MNSSTRNIIQACLRQERSAQQKLFAEYNQALFKTASIHLNDAQLAQEVTQQTWIDIFKGLSSYDENKSQLITWMRTILIRKIWTLKQHKSITVDLDYAYNKITHDSFIMDKMSCEELLNEMDTIPEGSRIVFKMYVLDGYSHSEIGQMLDISESTSRVHLTKARKIMKERYAAINQITRT